METEKTLVFVYGTLRKGGRYHKVLKEQNFLGLAKTEKTYPLYHATDVGFPFAVNKNTAQNKVIGEVYMVDQFCLQNLDHIEGHPGLFTRLQVNIAMDSGKKIKAWLYFGKVGWTKDGQNKAIISGDWFNK